jgi:hypothetical protein
LLRHALLLRQVVQDWLQLRVNIHLRHARKQDRSKARCGSHVGPASRWRGKSE